MAVRITCINKDNGNHDNPNEAISHFGWQNESTGKTGRATRQQMVEYIEADKGAAYVGTGASKVYCYVRTSPRGTKFLQTQSDGQWSNNLLSLPEC
jgi:hypothetical protein